MTVDANLDTVTLDKFGDEGIHITIQEVDGGKFDHHIAAGLMMHGGPRSRDHHLRRQRRVVYFQLKFQNQI